VLSEPVIVRVSLPVTRTSASPPVQPPAAKVGALFSPTLLETGVALGLLIPNEHATVTASSRISMAKKGRAVVDMRRLLLLIVSDYHIPPTCRQVV